MDSANCFYWCLYVVCITCPCSRKTALSHGTFFFLSGVTSCVSQDKKKKKENGKEKRKVQRYGDNTKTKNGQLRSTRHVDARRFRGGKHGHRKKRKCRKGLGNNFFSFSLLILFSLPFPPVSLSRRETHQTLAIEANKQSGTK